MGFEELAKAAKFRRFCRLLCASTGVSLVFASPSDKVREMLDYKREEAPLCEFLRRDSRFLARCRECDKLRCREAVSKGKGFFYKCHAGLVDMAVPLFIDGRHLGTFMGGQMLPRRPDEASFKEFSEGLEEFGYAREPLRRLFMAAPWMEEAKLRNIVDLVSLFSEHFQELGSRLLEDSKAKSPVDRAKEFMHANFRKPLSLEGVSSMFGLSAPYFSALFKKESGEGFSERLRRIRVEHAKRLLEAGEYEISRVASESGFASIASFNRCFKLFAGANPSSYRAKLRKRRPFS